MEGYRDILKRRNIEAKVVGDAPMFDVIFTNQEVVDYRSSLGDPEKAAKYNAGMRKRGILKSESKHYIGVCHTEADIEATIRAFDESMAEL